MDSAKLARKGAHEASQVVRLRSSDCGFRKPRTGLYFRRFWFGRRHYARDFYDNEPQYEFDGFEYLHGNTKHDDCHPADARRK